MKITEELIDKVLEEAENGALDPSPYLDSLKYLLMDDEDTDLTEEDHAYLIFLGSIMLETLKRTGQNKEIDNEEYLFDMEDANWDALDEAEGDLDVFIESLSSDYPEPDLLNFVAFSVLPVEDDDSVDGDEPVMSSEDAQVLGFMRLKAMADVILLPVV